ncbi:SDR family oxidoreductase [Acidimicrobiales bacterium]|jgi:D-xylose 1-dehydrogenase|nr:SDR family oxidoreductase [bacterium]MDC3299992.1 SDR family oxidoreductase [Acidimicrobiales bacterium]
MPKTFDLADGASTDPTAAPVQKYASYPSLVDRTVFITGGADGIGSAAVEHFVRQGSQVAFADINEAKALETIERCGGEARHVPVFHHVDLVDIEALQSAVATAQEDFGSLQVLVNNAANDDRHSWDEMTPEYWDDRINVNLRHYFFAIQAVAPAMLDARHGSIVNIGSSSYMRKEDFFPGYAIAKSGVEGITRTLAETFGPQGVRVNTVLPGWVATQRQLEKWWSPEGEAGTLETQALKRRIYADEFVQMVLFLAADDGAACTAQHFLVDGGRL